MPHSTISLTADDIDDLIYSSRTGDLESLKSSIESLSKTHTLSASSILTAAIDVDEDGLGSGSCLLHYPAANGNLEIVTYLLSLLDSTTEAASHTTAFSRQAPSSNFINHQNTSGNTPLHWAGMNGHLPIVQALIKAGADPEIINGAGRDAVVESEWSSKEGATDCAVWILKECGGLEKGIGEGTQEGESSERIEDDVESSNEATGGVSGNDAAEDK